MSVRILQLRWSEHQKLTFFCCTIISSFSIVLKKSEDQLTTFERLILPLKNKILVQTHMEKFPSVFRLHIFYGNLLKLR